jgi:all-trans-retinol 13,14-reductase
MCNFAINGSAESLGIGCSNLWLQPCAASAGHSLREGIAAYLEQPLAVRPEQVPLMLTFPSVKDRSWHGTHPEQTMCQSLALAPWRWFARFHDADDAQPPRHAPQHVSRIDQRAYDELKALWAERTRQVLVEHYPLVEGKIEFVDVSTPLTIEHFLPSGQGSAIGFDVTPERFVDADVIRRLDMRTTIGGLWLTGQDVLMCGQPLAQLSGIITALRVSAAAKVYVISSMTV